MDISHFNRESGRMREKRKLTGISKEKEMERMTEGMSLNKTGFPFYLTILEASHFWNKVDESSLFLACGIGLFIVSL